MLVHSLKNNRVWLQVQTLWALGNRQWLSSGEPGERWQHYSGGPPWCRGWPGASHPKPSSSGRHRGGKTQTNAHLWLRLLDSIAWWVVLLKTSVKLLSAITYFSLVPVDCRRHALCWPELWHCSGYSLFQVQGKNNPQRMLNSMHVDITQFVMYRDCFIRTQLSYRRWGVSHINDH